MPVRILEIYEAIGWGIMNAVRVLRACPHLRPLIRFVYDRDKLLLKSDSHLGQCPSS